MNFKKLLFYSALIVSFFFNRGCSDINSQNGTSINIANESAQAFLVNAIEREAANLVDPLPQFRLSEENRSPLQPGESISILLEDITGGYNFGDDIRLFCVFD